MDHVSVIFLVVHIVTLLQMLCWLFLRNKLHISLKLSYLTLTIGHDYPVPVDKHDSV